MKRRVRHGVKTGCLLFLALVNLYADRAGGAGLSKG